MFHVQGKVRKYIEAHEVWQLALAYLSIDFKFPVLYFY